MTINEMLERTGWTMKQFALWFGIPYRTIQNWVSGVRECPEYVRDLMKYKLFKEEIIMNTKITFAWAKEYDDSVPGNGFSDETDHIITDGVYDFEDYLHDHDVNFEESDTCEGLYWVLDEYGERTGEVYQIIRTEQTDEELVG